MTQYIILLLTAGLLSCCKEEPMGPIDPPIETEIFDLEWATRIDTSKEVIGTDNTQFYKDWVLVGGDNDDIPKIYGFNKITGTLDWTYLHQGIQKSNIFYSLLMDNIYIARTGHSIFAVDLDTRTLVWEYDYRTELDFSAGVIWYADGFIFLDGGQHNNTPNETSDILKFDINTGFVEIYYSAINGSISFSPHVYYTNPNSGREMFILNVYPNAGVPPPLAIQNLRAVDAITMQTIWETENFTAFYASDKGRPPTIYSDIVITGGDWSMYGFDINTGNKIWRTQVPDLDMFGIWYTTKHLLKDDRLYVNNVGPEIMCLNPIDGSVIWQNLTDASNCTANMVYYEKEDYLVYTSWGDGSVYVLDAFTGEKIHREHRYDDSSYNNDTVYDPESDMFFTSTYKHAVGFKINAPE